MQTVYIQLKRFVTRTISSDSTQLLFGSRFWTDIPICINERVQIRRLLRVHCRNSGMKGLTIDPSYPTILQLAIQRRRFYCNSSLYSFSSQRARRLHNVTLTSMLRHDAGLLFVLFSTKCSSLLLFHTIKIFYPVPCW